MASTHYRFCSITITTPITMRAPGRERSPGGAQDSRPRPCPGHLGPQPWSHSEALGSLVLLVFTRLSCSLSQSSLTEMQLGHKASLVMVPPHSIERKGAPLLGPHSCLHPGYSYRAGLLAARPGLMVGRHHHSLQLLST